MSERVLYIVVKLAASLIAGLAVMLAAAWLLAVAHRRSFAEKWRAVVVVWLAFVGSMILGIVSAVVLAQDVPDRLFVFVLVMLGLFIPFVMRSESMKKLK